MAGCVGLVLELGDILAFQSQVAVAALTHDLFLDAWLLAALLTRITVV